MQDETIEQWLSDRLESADATWRESRSFAPNSYGAGYDSGFVDALREVHEKLTELWGR